MSDGVEGSVNARSNETETYLSSDTALVSSYLEETKKTYFVTMQVNGKKT